MKTAEEIATSIFQDCAMGIIDPSKIQDIKDYAAEALKHAAEKAQIDYPHDRTPSGYDKPEVDKQSILNVIEELR